MADGLEKHGHEIEESRNKKIEKIRRAVQLIQNYNNDAYLELAEAELGEITVHPFEFKPSDKEGYFELVDKDTLAEAAHKKKVYARTRAIEEAEWKELWSIIKGQDHKQYSKLYKKLTDEEKNNQNHYYEWFDGSGLRGWWD